MIRQQRHEPSVAVIASQGDPRSAPTARLLLAAAVTAGPLAVFEAATGPSVVGRDDVPGAFVLYLAVALAGMALLVRQKERGELRRTPRWLRAWVGGTLVIVTVAALVVRLVQGLSLDHTPGKFGLPLLYALPIYAGWKIWTSSRVDHRVEQG